MAFNFDICTIFMSLTHSLLSRFVFDEISKNFLSLPDDIVKYVEMAKKENVLCAVIFMKTKKNLLKSLKLESEKLFRRKSGKWVEEIIVNKKVMFLFILIIGSRSIVRYK